MSIDWNKINRTLSPIKDFEDLSRRLQASFGYPFVREKFNFTMPQLVDYTRRLLGGDARGRYTDYLARLVDILAELEHAGVTDLQGLIAHVESRQKLTDFVEQSGVDAEDTVTVLKYLVYWFIPREKYLSGLVQSETLNHAVKVLREQGIRTNLDLLQQGITSAGRKALVKSSGLPEAVISELVNRADFSRLPWASKATISNIIGAGYGSLSQLAHADPEKLYADFFRYGRSIGKNLKLGNEIENSYRIARIVPALLKN
jgi:Domain of unknown function (DUF4332)